MEIGTNPDYDKSFAAVLDWWRDAGIDSAFQDEPRCWLPPAADLQVSTKQQADARTAQNTADPAPEPTPVAPTLPGDLDEFRSWWLTAAALDSGRVSGRVAPRGLRGAELMILAPMPEASDQDELLSGADGKLVDLFLTQAGLASDAVYRASVLPCYSPAADWRPDSNPLLGAAVRQHIFLARPKRLLVLGFNILPLLGHASAQGPAVSSVFNHEEGTVSMLAVRRIPALASQPRWKCILWQAWLDWTA